MDDPTSPIYGTPGYQAPEIAETGPTVASDLYTVGRTLAVLCTDFRGFQSTYRYTLAAAGRRAALRRGTTRCTASCERATAPNPDERFQTAEEMADQLARRAARGRRRTRPAAGARAEHALHPRAARLRPRPTGARCRRRSSSADDPAAGFLASLGAAEPDELVEPLRSAPRPDDRGRPLAGARAPRGRAARRGRAVLDADRAADPWEWRTAGTAGSLRSRRRPAPRRPSRSERVPRVARRARAQARARRARRVARRPRRRRRSGTRSCRAPTPPSRPPPSAWPAAAWRSATTPAPSPPTSGSRNVERLRRRAGRRGPRLLDGDGRRPIRRRRRAAAIVERVAARARSARPTHRRGPRGRAAPRRDGGLDGAARRRVLGLRAHRARRPRSASSRPTARSARHAATTAERIALVDRANRCDRGRSYERRARACAARSAARRRWPTTGSARRAARRWSTAAGRATRDHVEIDAGVAAGVSATAGGAPAQRGRPVPRPQRRRCGRGGLRRRLVVGARRRRRRCRATPRAARSPAAVRGRDDRGRRRRRSTPASPTARERRARRAVDASPATTWRAVVHVVAAVWDGATVTVGWVGDSRAYWIGATSARQLTADDSWAQEQVDAGRDAAARRPRPIGARTPSPAGSAPTRPTARRARVASDPTGPGRLVGVLRRSVELRATTPNAGRAAGASPPDGVAARRRPRARRRALGRGGHDNITVAVIDCPHRTGGEP